jgi:hypothetical protein
LDVVQGQGTESVPLQFIESDFKKFNRNALSSKHNDNSSRIDMSNSWFRENCLMVVGWFGKFKNLLILFHGGNSAMRPHCGNYQCTCTPDANSGGTHALIESGPKILFFPPVFASVIDDQVADRQHLCPLIDP